MEISATDNYGIAELDVTYTYNNTVNKATTVKNNSEYFAIIPVTGTGIIKFTIEIVDYTNNTVTSDEMIIRVYSEENRGAPGTQSHTQNQNVLPCGLINFNNIVFTNPSNFKHKLLNTTETITTPPHHAEH